jgi:hypothetical protein
MLPDFLTAEERVRIEAEEQLKEKDNCINPYESYDELLQRIQNTKLEEKKNEIQDEYLILIDLTGSEDVMQNIEKNLKLLLQSLSCGCFFNVYIFG